jgi:hypothetical protein
MPLLVVFKCRWTSPAASRVITPRLNDSDTGTILCRWNLAHQMKADTCAASSIASRRSKLNLIGDGILHVCAYPHPISESELTSKPTASHRRNSRDSAPGPLAFSLQASRPPRSGYFPSERSHLPLADPQITRCWTVGSVRVGGGPRGLFWRPSNGA